MISVAMFGMSFICAADAPALASGFVDSDAPAVDAPALASGFVDSDAPALALPINPIIDHSTSFDLDSPIDGGNGGAGSNPSIHRPVSLICGGYGGAGSVPSSNPVVG